MVTPISIAGRTVGPGQSCFVIAEAGVNHGGSLDTAFRLVDAASSAGADAVKFQSFSAEKLVTLTAEKASYQVENTGRAESQFEMLRKLELSHDDHKKLRSYCDKSRITFLSTPFDEESADFLEDLGVDAFKISSGDLVNLPLLSHIARKKKPLIISTGMSTLGEVDMAVSTAMAEGNSELLLLHCVSNYPAEPGQANLRAMRAMSQTFDLPVGFSDHTLYPEVALAAVALGASVLEKHLTLDRGLPGPDQRASIEPAELAALIRSIRLVEDALGNCYKQPTPRETDTMIAARRSLVAARFIAAGSVLAADMITLKRPGSGLPPTMKPYLLGRSVRVDIPAGTLLEAGMLA